MGEGWIHVYIWLNASAVHLKLSQHCLLNGYTTITTTTTKSLQSCPTLCDPVDGSPPRSPIPGILQARILERVAISFSNAGK